ncbi:MAG: lyase family protein, partial [Candidatus Binataceae bacterium]
LGKRGLEVQGALMRELRLGQPEIAWYTHRDRIAEVACFLAIVCGTLGKLATDVKLMMQTEVGEAFEPAADGRGSSSTMPQKRNPVASGYIIACAAMVRAHTGAILESMIGEHERATGAWEIEWVALPEIFILTAGALRQSREVVSGLEIDPRRMRENLEITHGLIVAEAVMMGLAPHLGRDRAHHLVSEISRRAIQSKRPLADLLAQDPEVTAHLDRTALEPVTEPANYLGLSAEMVDRVLDRVSPK